jgi:hypothetical protein
VNLTYLVRIQRDLKGNLFAMEPTRKQTQAQLRDYWLSHCGWCRREIGEDKPVIGISMKYRDPKDYRRYQGKVVQFGLSSGRTVIAGVVKPDSPAKKEGKDVIFMVCSDRCGHELSAAIRQESRLESIQGH